MTHFHLMRTQKHKILSIIVLKMAKYTIISLILIDFVPINFIFNLFQTIFRGLFRFTKIPSSKKSKIDFWGGQTISIKSQVQKSPNSAEDLHFGPSPKFLIGKLTLCWTLKWVYTPHHHTAPYTTPKKTFWPVPSIVGHWNSAYSLRIAQIKHFLP